MAESLPPTGHRYDTRRNPRKRPVEEETSQEPSPDVSAENDTEDASCSQDSDSIDCAICLQSCVHPARLPCGHIFCFLCLKGVFRASAKCAMCRRPIPRNYLETPELLEIPTPSSTNSSCEDGYQWFYEGRHGWWEYDPRANDDLEAAFLAGESKIELLIAGYVYLVDLHGMMQYRKSDPRRRRSVKRDKIGAACKGVAGIRPSVLQAMGTGTNNDADSVTDYLLLERRFGALIVGNAYRFYYSSSEDDSDYEDEEDEEDVEDEEDSDADGDEDYE